MIALPEDYYNDNNEVENEVEEHGSKPGDDTHTRIRTSNIDNVNLNVHNMPEAEVSILIPSGSTQGAKVVNTTSTVVQV